MDNKNDYINLKNQILSIRNNLYDLTDRYKKVNISLKNNIIVDKKTIGEEQLHILENNIDSVLYQINNVLIPVINKKINS